MKMKLRNKMVFISDDEIKSRREKAKRVLQRFNGEDFIEVYDRVQIDLLLCAILGWDVTGEQPEITSKEEAYELAKRLMEWTQK